VDAAQAYESGSSVSTSQPIIKRMWAYKANYRFVRRTGDSLNVGNPSYVPKERIKEARSICKVLPDFELYFCNDATGLMQVMHDANGNLYSYYYDLMGRKTKLTYPSGGGIEGWTTTSLATSDNSPIDLGIVRTDPFWRPFRVTRESVSIAAETHLGPTPGWR
jgi:hypothetical protein